MLSCRGDIPRSVSFFLFIATQPLFVSLALRFPLPLFSGARVVCRRLDLQPGRQSTMMNPEQQYAGHAIRQQLSLAMRRVASRDLLLAITSNINFYVPLDPF